MFTSLTIQTQKVLQREKLKKGKKYLKKWAFSRTQKSLQLLLVDAKEKTEEEDRPTAFRRTWKRIS